MPAASASIPTRFRPPCSARRRKPRASWSGSGDKATETIWYELKDKLGATEFLGYDTEIAEGVVQAIVRDGKALESASKGETVQLVLNQTPFLRRIRRPDGGIPASFRPIMPS